VKRIVLAVALAACSHPAAPVTKAAPAEPALESDLPIQSDEITFVAGGRTIPGTFVWSTQGKQPGVAPRKRPTVVLMAGSGPTDRDWNSPLLEGKNGSAKLLAEALAHHGFQVLRFDKAATGGNKIEIAQLAFDTYVVEGRAALAWARTQSAVDPAHLFIAGHSEGGIHATRVAQAEGKGIAGLMLLSAPGRSMKAVMMAQLTAQFDGAVKAGSIPRAMADSEIAAVNQAFVDFEAGKPVDPSKVGTIPQLQQLVAAVTLPQTADLSRPLFAFEPVPALAQVGVPVFIYNGKHDIQVDADVDAKALAAAKPDATVFLAPEANHVLKHEPRDQVTLRAELKAVQDAYNAPDSVIDAATIDAIVGWLAKISLAR
jgi:pimeloyl-ACP methyl ester carboxylesterase